MPDSIEEILKQKLGLDANSVGSRIIDRAVQQRQKTCQVSDRTAYLSLLRASPEELNQLIEAVVIPETWFFRDREPFEYLREHVQQLALSGQQFSLHPFQALSIPCSTGEEPYSIAITLLEAGLAPHQFRVDAVDVSLNALTRAKAGIYHQKAFRGQPIPHQERYFQQTAEGYEVCPTVRDRVHFIHGNILEPFFLTGKQYHAIFCRNLLIYLDATSRCRALDALDRALAPQGILFLGAVETPQIANRPYRAIAHSSAFAFQKQPPSKEHSEASASQSSRGMIAPAPSKAATTPQQAPSPTQPLPGGESPDFPRHQGRLEGGEFPQTNPSDPTPANLAHPPPTSLETAKQLADGGQLSAAATLCESYVRAHPEQASAYLLLGEIYQGLNQTQQAEQALQKAVYLNPEAYEALIHLALLKEQQGHPLTAERFRKRARRLIHQESQQSQSGS